MLKQSNILPHKFLILPILVLMFSSCGQQPTSREYEEIVTTSSQIVHGSSEGDHAHSLPPMSSPMPGMSRGMQLPAGSDNQQTQRALDASVKRPPLSWKTPDGWKEEKASGMRLATFRAQGKGGDIECSIISLAGMAGGLESNVVRWIRQINAPVPSDKELKSFLSRQEVVQTKGGFSATVIDLTELPGSKEGEAPSMIAAVAELPDMTIFVKMTGSKTAVLENKDSFVFLCKSLNLN